MVIENSVTGVFNAIVKNQWQYVTDEIKEKNFFIFNRYISKKYPRETMMLNTKGLDKVAGMDILFCFLYNKSRSEYPGWLWSKTKNVVEKKKEHKDDVLLKEKLDVDDEQLMILKTLYAEELAEELKYFKLIEKNK